MCVLPAMSFCVNPKEAAAATTGPWPALPPDQRAPSEPRGSRSSNYPPWPALPPVRRVPCVSCCPVSFSFEWTLLRPRSFPSNRTCGMQAESHPQCFLAWPPFATSSHAVLGSKNSALFSSHLCSASNSMRPISCAMTSVDMPINCACAAGGTLVMLAQVFLQQHRLLGSGNDSGTKGFAKTCCQHKGL